MEKYLENQEIEETKTEWDKLIEGKIHLREEYLWNMRMKSKPKLRTYIKYKSSLEMEGYLKNEDATGRMMLARIRSGMNNLRIETGRYEKVAVKYRVCRLCNLGVEDEEHFLNVCKAYEDIREECIKENIFNLNNEEIKIVMFGI